MVYKRPVKKNCKELSIRDKLIPTGWRQESVINSEIYLAWPLEWMRFAGSSLYADTVCRVAFFIADTFLFAYTVQYIVDIHVQLSRIQQAG
jgi:hypothetical protein